MNGFDLSKNVVATDFNYPKISLIHIGIDISISNNDWLSNTKYVVMIEDWNYWYLCQSGECNSMQIKYRLVILYSKYASKEIILQKATMGVDGT